MIHCQYVSSQHIKVVAEFRKEIDEEAKESGKDKLSLSAAVIRQRFIYALV